MANFNQVEDIKNLNIEKSDYMLGKGLMMPFNPTNSGSRKIMYGSQAEQRLGITKPDVPYVGTGYESLFGQNSSSFNKVEEDLEVIGCVAKFEWCPMHHYFVFAINRDNGGLRVFERKEYKHITENYGYLLNNDMLDALVPGNMIPKGTVIQKSNAFDEYDNRMDGKNLLTLYSSCEETMEDAIVISESASKKLSSPLIKKVSIIVNDNDIPLNLYGDIENYKVFPDIGEESVNSILCGFRREKKEEALFSQSYARLRELSISDEKYTVAGRVVDVDVYCNAPEKLGEYEYNTQFKKYYDNNLRMANQIIDILDPYIAEGCEMEYDLQVLYYNCKGILSGKHYFSEREFSNIVINVTLIEEIPVLRGDKLSNRYGGKGITARVKPDELMPKTLSGETVDIILNMCGVYGRENAGQLFEITVTYICMKIIEFINLQVLDIDQCIELYLNLLRIVSPSMADYTEEQFTKMTDDECIAYMAGICATEKCMYLAIEPMSEAMTLDKVEQLYQEFPWAKAEHMLMPITDSAGEIKYIPSRRPLIYGYQYIYRLKQYAEEKFSVTSLSATNIRNENSKSKSSNNYRALYSRTPIRFGDMETGNLIHLGAELVVQMLMLYSTSPHARRLAQEMLTGDAFNIDVKLDEESKNRNVEILNVYLKTMGLKLVFSRKPKQYEQPMLIEPMYFYDNPHRLVEGLIPLNKDEKFDMEAEVLRLIKEKNHEQWAMDIYPMEFTREPGAYEKELAAKEAAKKSE